MAGRMLRLREVCAASGMSKSTVWMGVKNKTFPQPVRCGTRCTRWIESEIEAWKAARIADRDGPKLKPGKGRKGGAHGQEQHAA